MSVVSDSRAHGKQKYDDQPSKIQRFWPQQGCVMLTQTCSLKLTHTSHPSATTSFRLLNAHADLPHVPPTSTVASDRSGTSGRVEILNRQVFRNMSAKTTTLVPRKSNRLIKGKKIQQAVLGESAFVADIQAHENQDPAPSHNPSTPTTSSNDPPAALSRSWLSLNRKSRQSTISISETIADEEQQVRSSRSSSNLRESSMFNRERLSKGNSPGNDENLAGSYFAVNGSTASVGRSPAASTGAIDVEAAITLLQELRKTASPEELVALHRALLPTKQIPTIASPDSIDDEDRQTQPASRRRSNILPGLATRGGADGDLLRRQGDFLTVQTPSNAISPSIYSPDVTEKDMLNGKEEPRPHTPGSGYISAGAYAQGTLRITNGTSPPASVRGKSSLEFNFEDQASRIAASNELLDEQLNNYNAIRAQMRNSIMTVAESPTALHFRTNSRDQQDILTPPKPQFANALPTRGRAGSNAAMMAYDEFGGSPFEGVQSPVEQKPVERSFDIPTATTLISTSSETMVSAPAPKTIETRPLEPINNHAAFDFDTRQERNAAPRPTKPLHADSGYGSESSGDSPNSIITTNQNDILAMPKADMKQNLQVTTVTARQSLYTFEQVVASPPDFFDDTKEEENENKRPSSRHRSLFKGIKLGKSKESESDLKKLAAPSKKSTVSLVSSTTSPESATPEESTKKSKPKKLTKVAPHHIKKARKELARLEIAAAQYPPESERISIKSPQDIILSPSKQVLYHETELSISVPAPPERRFSLKGKTPGMMKRGTDEKRIRENQRGASEERKPNPVLPKRSSSYQALERLDTRPQTQVQERSPQENWPLTKGMDDQTASAVARKRSKDYSVTKDPEFRYEEQTINPPQRTPPAVPMQESPRTDFITQHQYQDSSSPESMRSEVREMVAARRRQELELLGVDPKADMPSMAYPTMGDRPASAGRAVHSASGNDTTPDWDAQAKIWAERKKSAGVALQNGPKKAQNTPVNQLTINTNRLSGARPYGPRSFATQRLSVVDEGSAISPMEGNIDFSMLSPTHHAPSPISDPTISPLDPRSMSSPHLPSMFSHPATIVEQPYADHQQLAQQQYAAAYADEYEQRPKSGHAVPDRYSGGLQYEWHRDTGFGGSAGTRVSGHEGLERSQPAKVAYGLDLYSDAVSIQQEPNLAVYHFLNISLMTTISLPQRQCSDIDMWQIGVGCAIREARHDRYRILQSSCVTATLDDAARDKQNWFTQLKLAELALIMGPCM
ncbi:hypothetical protein MRB53_037772 [Persea americana]|nr:hypothetical protein MRB53_037772 [Persea americana]